MSFLIAGIFVFFPPSISKTVLFYLPASPSLISGFHRQLCTLQEYKSIFLFVLFLQSVSSAEVRDCGHGEETREGHHTRDWRRRKRRGHDSDGSRRSGDQWQRGHAGHQLLRLLNSTGGMPT